MRKEHFEDTERVMRSRKSKKNRRYNGQMKKDKKTYNDLQKCVVRTIFDIYALIIFLTTKRYIENKRSGNTNSTKNRGFWKVRNYLFAGILQALFDLLLNQIYISNIILKQNIVSVPYCKNKNYQVIKQIEIRKKTTRKKHVLSKPFLQIF
jgi:hypothetical protein